MPYVITTSIDGSGEFESRRAVATLEEAGDRVADIVTDIAGDGRDGRDQWDDQIAAFTESGGTVGPLPDGTVIEVRAEMTEGEDE